MNWTGGRLQRHSNAPDTARHRQQQHFAKVKANLLARKKRLRPKHPNLNYIQEPYEGPNRTVTRDWQPVERDSKHAEIQSHAQRSLQTSNRAVYESISVYEHKTHQQSSPASDCNLHVVDVAIYDSSRSADAKKRERECNPSTTLSNDGNGNEKQDSLAQKRRKILQTGDWVGISSQRTPRLKYVPPRKEAQIGRRRKVLDSHRARYGTKLQCKILPLVAPRDQRLPMEGFEQKACRKSGPTDVKISVGNKVILPGVSSSAQSKRYSDGSLHPQAESLDIMLLDNESRRTNIMQSWSRPSTIRSKNGGMTTPQPQFRSSSASLHHPKPQSSKLASILRSDSSDLVESTLAQVGRCKPVVTSSQAIDNEIWETWMTAFNLPDDTLSGGVASEEDDMRGQIDRISPGVSAAPTYAITNNNGDGSHTHSDYGFLEELLPSDLADCSDSGLDLYAESDILGDCTANIDNLRSSPPQESLFQSSLSASSALLQSNFKDLSPIPELACDNESQASQSQPSSPSNRSSGHSSSSAPSLERQKNQHIVGRFITKETFGPELSLPAPKQSIGPEQNSADEIWRQFVFGSDSEEVDIFHRHVAAVELAHVPANSEESYLVPQEFLHQSPGYSVATRSSAVNFLMQDHQHLIRGSGSQDLGGNFGDETRAINEPVSPLSYIAHYSTAANATSSYDSDMSQQYSNYLLPSSSSNLASTNFDLRGSSMTPVDLPSQVRPRKSVTFTNPTPLTPLAQEHPHITKRY